MATLVKLVCSCGHVEAGHLDDALRRLQSLGKLRRAQDPDPELVVQLLYSAAGSLRCEDCGKVGLSVEPADQDDDWPETKSCERCNSPIPLERLEVLPEARFCTACQNLGDVGADEEREFCPRCGGLMKVRSSRGSGIARYEMICQDCGAKA